MMAESEAGFLAAVVHAARALGWRAHHTRPGRTRHGQWRTPLQGDAGFPDLVLARGGALILAELKSERGRITSAQAGWLESLRQVRGIEVYLWRPSDWPAIIARLRQGTEPAHACR
jgi:hypothetical protein